MGLFDEVLENVGKEYTGGMGKGFKYGTHPVKIMVIDPIEKKVKANDAAAVIEVEVMDPTDEERTGKATLYFHTEGGAKMSVTKVLGLLVHKVPEDKKEAVRTLGKKLFGGITDLTEARDVAAKLLADKLVGAEGFFFADPQGKYDTTSYGDLWHYEYEDPNADDRADAKADAAIEGTPLTEKEAEELPDFDGL